MYAHEQDFAVPESIIMLSVYLSTPQVENMRRYNLAAIEIRIWEKIKFDGDIFLLQKELSIYFNRLLFAKTLHDPNYISHAIERKIREEELVRKVSIKTELNKEAILPTAKFQYTNIEKNKSLEIKQPTLTTLNFPHSETKNSPSPNLIKRLIGICKRFMKHILAYPAGSKK